MIDVKTNPEIDLPPLQTKTENGGALAPLKTIDQGDGTLVGLMAKMATDANCDVEKFERLVRLNIEVDKLRRDEELGQLFNEAMNRAQSKMRAVVKDKDNDQTRSKYASYAALDRAVRPIYTGEGFSLSFNEGDTPKQEYVRVLCDVAHGGYTRHYHVDMPADGKGAKGGDVMTRTHATGSAFTYGQRNLLKLIFNLATVDADDDGNAAGAGEKISADEAAAIRDMLKAAKMPEARFLKWAKAKKIEDIGVEYYESCVEAIRTVAMQKQK